MKVYEVSVTGSPKICESDTFPTAERVSGFAVVVGKMLSRVDDNVFCGINLPKRLADVKARNPIGAPNLNTNLRSRAPDQFLNEISLFLRNPRVKRAIDSVFGDDGLPLGLIAELRSLRHSKISWSPSGIFARYRRSWQLRVSTNMTNPTPRSLWRARASPPRNLRLSHKCEKEVGIGTIPIPPRYAAADLPPSVSFGFDLGCIEPCLFS